MNKIKAKIQQTQETIKLSGIYHNYIYHDETLDGHGTAQDKLRISDTAQEKINQAIEYGQEIKTYSERIAHVETQSAEAQTNASQALAQVGNKQDRLTPGTNITIENNVISASGNVESVNTKTGVVVLTGDDISADVSELTDTVQGHLQTLHDNIKDIELFKFPNATIIGEPVIQNGQISGFTANDYLQFPFIVDLHNQPFQIDFCFTTGDDVTTQQNVLDSQFGIALAIQNSKGLMAISHNGTSWAGAIVGNMTIQPNTTYYARLSWNRINYQTQLSTDGITYTPDMNFGSTQAPYPRTMFIGGCSGSAIGHTPHPFGGTINLNYAYLTVGGSVIWQGMDDAGLATRADVSLDNLDEFGQAKFDAKQDKLTAGAGITIDESTNTISATGGGSGSGRNIGDIFYTTRTDTALSGAVECNGGTYSTADYTGTGSIGELLRTGKLPYVSLADYENHLRDHNGICGTFGWNGGTSTAFRVPLLKDVFIESALLSDGHHSGHVYAGLPDHNHIYTEAYQSGANSSGPRLGTSAFRTSYTQSASLSNPIYGNSDTVQPEAVKYRAMVQLFNSTTDEAVATVGTVVAQVGELNAHRVIDFQIPTAENNYTWYRKYADGWVEQGGIVNTPTADTTYSVSMPIEMSDTNYLPQLTTTTGNNNAVILSVYTGNAITTTGFSFRLTHKASNTGTPSKTVWEIKGMAKIGE